MIVMMFIMLLMFVLTRVMLTLVHVFLIRNPFKVGLEFALALTLRQRAHLHVDVTTGHLRLLVSVAHSDKVGFDLGGQSMAQLLVGHLAATELKLDAHFVTFSQEIFCVDDLDEVIMRINANAEFQLL